MRRLRYRLALAVMAAVLMAGAPPARALKIMPFKASMTPRATGAGQVFMIENNSAEPAAVQVSVMTWSIAPDGTETNRDAEDSFSVFPAQLVLSPHESRAVRVQWLDPQTPQVEQAYRVVAEQIPIRLKDTPPAASAVRFMLRFRAALYITPEKAAGDVTVESVSAAPDGQSLRVTLANRGTAHTILRNPSLQFDLADGTPVTLSGAPLSVINGENIHARAMRYFDISDPSVRDVAARLALQGRTQSATLTFDPSF